MPEEQKSFWQTVPGIITAFATLITAIGGFLVVLNQLGVFGNKTEKKDDAKNTGIVREQQLQSLGSDEVKERQAALEAKIREMEAKLQQQQSSGSSQPQEQPFNIAQIGGTWYDAQGAYYNIVQVGNQVTLEEISNLYGVATRTAAGQGSVIGKVAIINVSTLFNTTGTARLQFSDDQSMLVGEYKDNVAGTTTYLRLSKSPTNFDDQ